MRTVTALLVALGAACAPAQEREKPGPEVERSRQPRQEAASPARAAKVRQPTAEEIENIIRERRIRAA